MGKINSETQVNVPHEILLESEEINVQPSGEAEEPIRQSATNSPETLLIGTIADLLEEIKTVIAGLPPNEKEETVLLFKALLSRYPQLILTRYQEAINFFIYNSLKEKATFDLKPNEIKSWWYES